MMTVAYLVNQYPKVSHTFIRREIRALESLGFQVRRFSIRRSPDRLDDPEDAEEQRLTRVILDASPSRVARAVARVAAERPARFARALELAMRIGWRSERGALINVAYLGEACLLLDWLRASGVRHLHAHFGTNPAAVAMLCHELGGPSWSFTVHGPEEFDKPAAIALSEKVHRARFVVAISSFGKSQLMRITSPADHAKIHVVRCGVDASYLEDAFAPPCDRPRLVCVGRLSEQKGHGVLIDAAAELAGRGLPFELVLVGDGELRPRIEQRIAELGLTDRVRITGWLDGAGVRAELRAARAFVLPSFAEGLPVVIMEALALGRPVVSTFVAGIPELVEPGKSGWLVPAGSVEDLANALASALDAPLSDLAEMGRYGHDSVMERHDVMQNTRSLASLMQAEAG